MLVNNPNHYICVFEYLLTDLLIDLMKIYLQVTGVVLRGIFLLRKKELDWFYEGGVAAIYPDGKLQFFVFG